MIETYKILHGLYDTVAPSLMMSQVSHTRGNMYKLQKNVFKYDSLQCFDAVGRAAGRASGL